MLKKVKSDYLSWIIIIGLLILFLEFTFFNRGLIFSLFVQIGMIYLGKKWINRAIGKFLFWGGIVMLVLSILSMLTFQFFLFAILIHLLIQFYQTKKSPKLIQPVIQEKELTLKKEETVIQKKPLLTNVLFGEQQTPQSVFEWNDVNIQTGIGDTIIDLSYTVLPKGETVIFIRNFIGNIQLLVPYDIEVNVNYSAVAGNARILDMQAEKMFNQSLQIQSAGYEQAEQKIKIFTSVFVGNIEVKRV